MLSIYHAFIDFLSFFFSYHLTEFILKMIQSKKDDIITITMSELNQLFERFNYLKNQRVVLLFVFAFASMSASFIFILSLTFDLKLHIADSILFSDKRIELQNFFFKCHFKFADQSFNFKMKQFKIYYFDFHFTNQAHFSISIS